MGRFAIAALLLLAACTPVRRIGPRTVVVNQAAVSVPRGATSGQRQRVDALWSLNPDCSSIGYWTIRIVRPPQHGSLTIDYGAAFSTYPKRNARAVCNTRQTPATVVNYTSYPGYAGPDIATVEMVSPTGEFREVQYRIAVL